MKKQITFLVLFCVGADWLLAVPNSQKQLTLRVTDEDIIIDGVIDPVWSHADSVSDFIQQRPYHGARPSDKTVAKVLTTDEALYCLMLCSADRQTIQRQTGKLDDFGGDVVSIMLDTFGKKHMAYKFAVTATGVRADSKMLDDARDRDYSWDGIWFSYGKVYDWGFVVEMKIPYKSIQYDEKLNQWGLDFDRWIPARNEDIYWCAYEENEGQRISKFGRLLFADFHPTVKGLNLEIYPVGISKVSYRENGKYKGEPDAGIDIFYNPSPKLTFQLTANPDFAQIEADPFEFNISRYETYFEEKRPFFTEGNEIFMASGRHRDSGFYRPLELFYSRRIGKKLPDGTEVPLLFGTKAFGRIGEWEYGGFMALTGEKQYLDEEEALTEPSATFGSARLKKQIFGNSSVGFLMVGKHTDLEETGVIDIDGAFRQSNWQLAYQFARSFNNLNGDFAGSAGFRWSKENWFTAFRGRYIGDNFNVDQVGYVPWQGTSEFVGLTGPRWYFERGYISRIMWYGGGFLNYEKVDAFTDRAAVIGFNMQFRNNWGYEINVVLGEAKDESVRFKMYNVYFDTWCHVSPKWNVFFHGGYENTYNFSRDYLAYYTWLSGEFEWQALNILNLGTSASVFVEGNPQGKVEDITYNARPYVSTTPVNNLNIRIYFDNLFVRSADRVEQTILGFLFSYNFSPKSWIYFAINDFRDRSDQLDSSGKLLPNRLHVVDRAGVFKLKYLYYF